MNEAQAREHCRTRDRGRCRVPGCFAMGRDLHHLTYRSHLAPEDMWDTDNLVSLCRAHHALVHSGDLEICGNGNGLIEVSGNDFEFLACACHLSQT